MVGSYDEEIGCLWWSSNRRFQWCLSASIVVRRQEALPISKEAWQLGGYQWRVFTNRCSAGNLIQISPSFFGGVQFATLSISNLSVCSCTTARLPHNDGEHVHGGAGRRKIRIDCHQGLSLFIVGCLVCLLFEALARATSHTTKVVGAVWIPRSPYHRNREESIGSSSPPVPIFQI